jgi:hypothetical protein
MNSETHIEATPYTLREFIDKATQGVIGPGKEIRIRNPCGDQIHEISFEDCGKKLCQSHDVDPISLYHAIQQGINSDMIQRINRSKIFRKKVEMVVCDEWGNCEVLDMFADNLDEPYDQATVEKDSHIAAQIREALSQHGNDDPMKAREHLVDLREACNGCLGNVRQGQIRLNEDYEKYHPNHADSWKSLAMKHYPYYLQSIKDSGDPRHQAFAEKQLKRVIPEHISGVFSNGDMIPTLMRKENRKISQRLRKLEEDLVEDLQKIHYLIDSLPESPETDEAKGLLAGILEKLGLSDGPSDEEPGDDDNTPKPSVEQMVEQMVAGDQSEQESEQESDQESDDQESDQEGGRSEPVYHLSFF